MPAAGLEHGCEGRRCRFGFDTTRQALRSASRAGEHGRGSSLWPPARRAVGAEQRQAGQREIRRSRPAPCRRAHPSGIAQPFGVEQAGFRPRRPRYSNEAPSAKPALQSPGDDRSCSRRCGRGQPRGGTAPGPDRATSLDGPITGLAQIDLDLGARNPAACRRATRRTTDSSYLHRLQDLDEAAGARDWAIMPA